MAASADPASITGGYTTIMGNLTRYLLDNIMHPSGAILDPELKGVVACNWWISIYDPKTMGIAGEERPGLLRDKLREFAVTAVNQLAEERRYRILGTEDDNGQRVFRRVFNSVEGPRVIIADRFMPLLNGCTFWGGGELDPVIGKGPRGEFVAAVMPMHPGSLREPGAV